MKFSSNRVLAVEPNVAALPSNLAELDNVALTEVNTAIDQADIIVLLVDHNEFINLWRQDLDAKTIIDTKGLWPRQR